LTDGKFSNSRPRSQNDLFIPSYLKEVEIKRSLGEREKGGRRENVMGTVSFPHSISLNECLACTRDHVSHWEYICEQSTIPALKELV
jgi:hypothetical protein